MLQYYFPKKTPTKPGSSSLLKSNLLLRAEVSRFIYGFMRLVGLITHRSLDVGDDGTSDHSLHFIAALRPLPGPPAPPPGSSSPLIDHRRASWACACTGAHTRQWQWLWRAHLPSQQQPPPLQPPPTPSPPSTTLCIYTVAVEQPRTRLD